MVERFNRTPEEYLRKVVNEQQKDWDELISRFLLAYLSAVHDSTSKSPAKVIFWTKIKLIGDWEFGVKPATEGDATHTGKEESLNELHEFLRTHIKMVSDRIKARYDTHSGRRDYPPSYKPALMDGTK